MLQFSGDVTGDRVKTRLDVSREIRLLSPNKGATSFDPYTRNIRLALMFAFVRFKRSLVYFNELIERLRQI